MADNIELGPGGGGATMRTYEDAAGKHWAPGVVAYATTIGDPDVLQPVTPAFPLPCTISGVATAAAQTTGNASLASIDGKITACNTGAVVVSESALPAGAATVDKQNSGNTSLAAILVSTGDAAEDEATGNGSVIAILKRLRTLLAGTLGVNLSQYTPAAGRLPVDGSGVTQPISVASLPLPTGAATAASQATLIAHVDNVETLLNAIGNLLTTIDSDTGTLAAVDYATQTTLAAVLSALQGTLTVAAHAVTQSGAWSVTANAGTNLNTSALALEATLGAVKTAVELLDNCISGNEAQVDIVAALPAGANTIGSVGVVTLTTGGATPYSFLSTAAVQAAELKGSAGQVYGMQFFNLNAAARYVRIYNQTGAPATTDAANIVWRGMIPGNTAAGGFIVPLPGPIVCGTGIGIRVTAAIADNDGTALAANEIMGNVQFK